MRRDLNEIKTEMRKRGIKTFQITRDCVMWALLFQLEDLESELLAIRSEVRRMQK